MVNRFSLDDCFAVRFDSELVPRLDNLDMFLDELKTYKLNIAVKLDTDITVDFSNVGELCQFFYQQGTMAKEKET